LHRITIGIDPGSSITKMIDQEGTILFDGRSALSEDRGRGFIAFGNDAWNMIGKTPAHIRILFPFHNRRQSDYEVSVAFFQHLFSQARSSIRSFRPEVVINLDSANTQVEKEAYAEALSEAGARKVYYLPDLLSLAIGAGLNVFEPKANMVMDLGHAHTEIALLTMGHIVKSVSVPYGLNRLRQQLQEFFQNHHSIMIGELTAEEILQNQCRCLEEGEAMEITIIGLDLKTGLPKQTVFSPIQLIPFAQEELSYLPELVFSGLEGVSPDLAKDILERGILLGGGGALLPGIGAYLEEKTQIRFIIPDHPHHCVVKGTIESARNESFQELTTQLL